MLFRNYTSKQASELSEPPFPCVLGGKGGCIAGWISLDKGERTCEIGWWIGFIRISLVAHMRSEGAKKTYASSIRIYGRGGTKQNRYIISYINR